MYLNEQQVLRTEAVQRILTVDPEAEDYAVENEWNVNDMVESAKTTLRERADELWLRVHKIDPQTRATLIEDGSPNDFDRVLDVCGEDLTSEIKGVVRKKYFERQHLPHHDIVHEFFVSRLRKYVTDYNSKASELNPNAEYDTAFPLKEPHVRVLRIRLEPNPLQAEENRAWCAGIRKSVATYESHRLNECIDSLEVYVAMIRDARRVPEMRFLFTERLNRKRIEINRIIQTSQADRDARNIMTLSGMVVGILQTLIP